MLTFVDYFLISTFTETLSRKMTSNPTSGILKDSLTIGLAAGAVTGLLWYVRH